MDDSVNPQLAAKAVRQLDRALHAIDSGEVEATSDQRAYLAGAVNALASIGGPQPDSRQPSLPAEVTSEVFGGLVSKLTEALILLQTGDVGLAAVMGGAAGGTTQGLVQGGERLWARRRQRLADAAEAARDESGIGPIELFHRTLRFNDERRLDLLLDAFRAASHEADSRRVRAYGRVAAAGVMAEAGSEVDIRRRVFDTLAELDQLDITVLLHMGREDDQPWYQVRQHPNNTHRILAAELPEIEDMLDPVIARLTGRGLLVDRLEDTSYGEGQ